MNSLDLIIVVILVAYAVSGFFQGFVVNLVATLGLLVGGLVALAVVPMLLSGDRPTLSSSLLALGLVIGAGAVGQAIGTLVGSGLRQGLKWRPLRSLDAVGGSALSIVAVLCAAWALGYSVSGTSIPYLSTASRDSAILEKVDGVMPARATSVLRSFNEVLDSNLFPRYIDPFDSEDITQVDPPDEETLASAGVRRARDSVVKILGQARCDRGIEGSGFAYADGRIMTNAHVVAGVASPSVVVGDREVPTRVVLFDRDLDIAVLAVEGLDLDPLRFDDTGEAGQAAAVLGYPQNGPFDARAARIRDEIRLRSPDIYDRGQVVRETFSVRGLVRSGNSGGPLVSESGDVLGVIFAASVSDKSTGYALTAKQVADDARKGARATAEVSTGDCA
ncbi:MarP family serine protease [Aeromicrobium fastidiosum]|uniref:MarP family serine protease n=1 Tax=Aeromicrobium fastidiosum TaxID=52699 RepID=A0A641ARL2_9ACTN|nr:MarP family serine protease [Aeromicrobium fastidiosum]KAA1380730.1 MarP family serine protease [Aeromicrobium fastidiosum]MBP2390347.1 S1-C subfamily serine protease [Aeromicrobium fastidiosum]